MNRSTYRKRSVIRPIVLALALALPGASAVTAELNDVVKTKPDQNIHEQYGRDSVYGFSPDSKPLKPDQTAARDSQGTTPGEASQFPSPDRSLLNDSMANDAASSVKATDARTEGIAMGSGYTGEELPGSTAMNSGNANLSGSDPAQYATSAVLIFPGTITAPTASADENEASNEFVIIVPIGKEDQSASLETEGGVAVD